MVRKILTSWRRLLLSIRATWPPRIPEVVRDHARVFYWVAPPPITVPFPAQRVWPSGISRLAVYVPSPWFTKRGPCRHSGRCGGGSRTSTVMRVRLIRASAPQFRTPRSRSIKGWCCNHSVCELNADLGQRPCLGLHVCLTAYVHYSIAGSAALFLELSRRIFKQLICGNLRKQVRAASCV